MQPPRPPRRSAAGEPQHWFDLFGRPLSRRDLLRAGRDLAACIALSRLPAEGAQDARTAPDPFPWGVASGDPAPDGVVLWTRVDVTDAPRAAGVRWEVAEDERFARIARQGTSLAPAQLGYTVHAEVDGLRPGREYFYRFVANGHASAVGRTRTAPAPDAAPGAIRFAFASCQNYEHGYYTAFGHLASEDLDFVVHLGDYIYERRFASSASVRQHEAGEVFTLDEYRGRYALYRSDAQLQAAHAACPWIVTTDDHEVANNYADAIAEVPTPVEAFLLRRAAAYQAYYEFMPLRRASLPAGPAMQLYRRLRFGSLLDLHVLDTRQFRSDQPCGDGRKPRCAEAMAADRTMLGAAQERWLERGLRGSRARWNVLANQVVLAQTKTTQDGQDTFSMDKWDGYVAAQRRMLRLLDAAPGARAIVVTGDVHANWVADLKADFDDPSSPIIGAEFVGTSISSGGDGTDTPSPALALNPHLKFHNAQRGYVRARVSSAQWTTDYRVVPYVTRPGAPVETRASWVVEADRPGVERA